MAYKRRSTTSKGTGVRRTTTYNRKTGGITRSTSIKTSKQNRVTYSTGPKGQSRVTRTHTDANGYVTRTSQNLNPKPPKVKKPPKQKVYKPPKIKAPKVSKVKVTRTRSRRSRGGSISPTAALWWVLGIIFFIAVFG